MPLRYARGLQGRQSGDANVSRLRDHLSASRRRQSPLTRSVRVCVPARAGTSGNRDQGVRQCARFRSAVASSVCSWRCGAIAVIATLAGAMGSFIEKRGEELNEQL